MRLCVLGLLLAGALPASVPAELERAQRLYNRTDYTAALRVLEPLSGGNQGPVYELAGKSYFMQGEFKRASEAFEKAIAVEPQNSVYHHWLGKAYGRRAEIASPFTAPGYAIRARKSFEQAVELDPKNIEAVNDLFQYYLQAPGFLGGGLEKASELIKKIRAQDPVEYHYALATLAERRKEFNAAEEHLRRAVELAPRQVGRIIDLARFLAKQGRVPESEAAFEQAEKIAPDEPKILFERANAYIRNKRNLDQAKALLERYLKSNLSPEDPPREEAQRLLKQVSGA